MSKLAQGGSSRAGEQGLQWLTTLFSHDLEAAGWQEDQAQHRQVLPFPPLLMKTKAPIGFEPGSPTHKPQTTFTGPSRLLYNIRNGHFLKKWTFQKCYIWKTEVCTLRAGVASWLRYCTTNQEVPGSNVTSAPHLLWGHNNTDLPYRAAVKMTTRKDVKHFEQLQHYINAKYYS